MVMSGNRQIPHLRDIFGGGIGPTEARDQQQHPAPPPPVVVEKRKEQEAKQLERHLSMKKTIRKKIMRELQEAWVLETQETDKNLLECLREPEIPPQIQQQTTNTSDKLAFWRIFNFRRNKR